MTSWRTAVALAVGGLLAGTAAVAETMEYQVTFESTWSAATHPLGFPPSPHFSGLIGGTHSSDVSFWDEAALASTGIQNMAEVGSKIALTSEVNAAITAGTADAVISGGGINPSPGTVAKTFTVDEAFPLVTLVAMLAPSPDWFVGVSGLPLRENDAWNLEVVVDLIVYDAGTDSGVNYTSPDSPTVPPVPISQLTTGAFAGNQVVGTFTFLATGAVGVAEGLPTDQRPLVRMGPNPFRGAASFQVRIPRGQSGELAVFGARGQRIRSLFRGGTAGDVKLVTWNGRDLQGAPVSAGVYFVDLRLDGGQRHTEKVVVAR